MFRRVLIGVFVAVALAIASPVADAATAHMAASEAGPEAAHTALEILHFGHAAGFPVGTLLPLALVVGGAVYLVKKDEKA